jgi:phage-related protein
MSLESLKKTAQDAFETAKGVVEKAATAVGDATTSAVEGVRSVAPESFDSAVKTVKETASTVAGRVTETATEAVDALRETEIGRSIAEGANTLAEGATSAGHRIGRAAQAATEAFNAEEPAKPEIMPEANTVHPAPAEKP